ncbi:MAG: hypothetical protein ACYC91_19940 [Solirubrobacteraceae bacterium]
MGPIVDQVEVLDKQLSFDGRIVTFVQRFKTRSYTEVYDVDLARWKLWESKTVLKRRRQLWFSIDTPGTEGAAQMVCAEGENIDALRAFVERVFQAR